MGGHADCGGTGGGPARAVGQTASVPTLRRATAGDVPALVALVESAYRGESSRAGWTTEADLLHGQRTDAAEVGRTVADAGARVLVLDDDDGGLLACCHLEPRAGGTAYFGMFAVRPGRQGSGVGSTVLAAAERVAVAELGATTLEMTVIRQRTELVAYYQRRGWVRTGDTRPFPADDVRFGVPQRGDLEFAVLAKPLV